MDESGSATDGKRGIGTMADALWAASDRFAAMLRRVSDPTVPAIGIWNIGETAAHASSSHGYFLAVVRGDPIEIDAIEGVAAANARVLAGDPERDPHMLADRLVSGEAGFISFLRSMEDDPLVEVFTSVKVPVSTAAAIELGELLVHGADIAKAAGLPWRIPTDEAALTLDGFLPLLPAMLDERTAEGLRMRCELRVRSGPRAVVAVDHGALSVEPPSTEAVDCRISVDPAAFLLLMFRRIPPWQPVLQGKLAAWGRRPWMALKLQSIFKKV